MCVARAIDLHVQLYGEISEKTKGLIRSVGRFKDECYAEMLEGKLERKASPIQVQPGFFARFSSSDEMMRAAEEMTKAGADKVETEIALAKAAAMSEEEAKNGEKRERSLMSRAEWGHSKKQPLEW